MILVDTSILIDFLSGRKTEGAEKLESMLSQKIPFGINSLIFQEVLQGASTEKDFGVLRDYLISQKFYHLKDPVQSYESAAMIYRDCRKRGITIRSTIDCLIAQTALEHDLLLLHSDKDFEAMAQVVPLKFW